MIPATPKSRPRADARWRWLRWLPLLFFAATASCSSSRAVISVTISGLTSEVVRLNFGVTLSDRPLVSATPVLNSASDSVSFRLDSQESGLLFVSVAAYGSIGCQIAGGSGQVDVSDPAASYSLGIDLSFDADQQGCKIIVKQTGAGSGQLLDQSGSLLCDLTNPSSSSDGSTCSSARYDSPTYSNGTTLSLSALPDDHSYLAGWSGACTGTGTCQVSVGAEPTVVTLSLLHDRLCSGSYCWEHPLPQGDPLYTVFVGASNDIWMGGEVGTLLHWNGVYTDFVSSTTQQTIHALWGSTNSDVWGFGAQGSIIRYQGSSWSTVASSTTTNLNAAWGSSATSIWTAGDAGTILKWNGSSWDTQKSGTGNALYGMWGRDANNVWAVGDGGTILKWNGSVWTAQVSGRSERLTGVWGGSQSGVWVVGKSGGILYSSDGQSWTSQTTPAAFSGGLFGIWGSSIKDLWAVGDNGAVLHSNDGSKSAAWSLYGGGRSVSLYGVAGSGSSDVWVVGDAGLVQHDSGVFFADVSQAQSYSTVRALWGSSATDVWAVGSSGTVIRSNGSRWLAALPGNTLLADYRAIVGRSSSDVWVAGAAGTVMNWSGSKLTAKNGPLTTSTIRDNLNALLVVGSGPGNVVAAGEGGTIIGYDGSSWSRLLAASLEVYNGIWGRDLSNVWVVGNGGVLRHGVSGTYSLDAQSAAVTQNNLRAIAGPSSSRLWAVGDSGTILQYDGSKWSLLPSGTTANLYAVWSNSSGSEVWAVGAHGTILHADSSGVFKLQTTLTATDLFAVWGDSTGLIEIAGTGGTIIRYRP